MSLIAQQSPLQVAFDISDIDENNEVDVTMRVKGFTELYGVQTFIHWDSTVLQVIGTHSFATDLAPFSEANIALPSQDMTTPRDGKLRLSWSDLITHSLADDSPMFSIRFKVIGGECAESEIFVANIGTSQSQISEILNVNFDNIGISQPDDHTFMVPGAGCISSLESIAEHIEVSLQPNPATDYIQINVENLPSGAYMNIVDNAGRTVSTQALSSNNTKVDVSQYVSGTYFYELLLNQKTLKSGQFIKE